MILFSSANVEAMEVALLSMIKSGDQLKVGSISGTLFMVDRCLVSCLFALFYFT